MVLVSNLFLTALAFTTILRFAYGLEDRTPPIIGATTEMRMRVNGTLTNRWSNFNDWQCNAPPSGLQTSQLGAYYSGDECGERILIISKSTSRPMRTWSYRLGTNSWGIVETNDRSLPPVDYNETGSALLTVCQSNVLYISGHSKFKSFLWLFDGQSETWYRKRVVGDTAPLIAKNESSLYFVLLNKTATSCKCCHVIVGFSDDLSVVWKLGCSDVNSRRQFTWEKMKAGSNRSRAQLSKTQALYPRKAVYLTASAVTEEGAILVMADETWLWKYDMYSNQWHAVDSLPLSGRGHFSSYRGFFFSKDRLYGLFPVIDTSSENSIVLYSLKTRTRKTVKMSPRYQHPVVFAQPQTYARASSVITTRSGRQLFYSSTDNKCDPSLWELQGFELYWSWTRIKSSKISPLSFIGDGETVTAVSQVCFGNTLYVLVEIMHPNDAQSKLQLWELQLNSMTWVLLHATGVDDKLERQYSRGMALFYGKIVVSFPVTIEEMTDILAYNTKNMSWNRNFYVFYDERKMAPTYDFCVAPFDSSAVLLYGGKSSFDYPNRSYFCNLRVVMMSSVSSDLQWLVLEPGCEQKNSSRDRPPNEGSRFECVVDNDTFILIGGKYGMSGVPCYRHVWYFSFIHHSWELAFNHTDVRTYNPKMCATSAVMFGPQVVVAFRDDPFGDVINYELWFYIVRTRTWIFHSNMISMENFLPFISNRNIVFLSEDLSGLSYKRLFCPPGYSSQDISREWCKPCPKGFYALGEGEKTCNSCPSGLVTASVASSSISNCSFCNDNFCFQGHCLVLYDNGVPRPYCQCRLGFSGPHCTNPQTVLLTLGIVVVAAAIVVGLVCVVRLWRKRKVRERRLLHHVEELTTVWQIGNEEITRLERIGAGGYGEVYRARYRDMSVAMKVLRGPTNDSLMEEFEQEIKFMQTVRHPNIVLFLGAGRTRDGSPFLVSELVARGSLRDLLDDYSQVLSVDRKINFALDIARGMNFLHSLTPPRVHRDLKTDNLLISETDVVKITDFGLGKQVCVGISDHSQQHRARYSIRRLVSRLADARLPLLDLRGQESPHAVGAARWRAPELSVSGSTTRYTTAADVYSFGIVVWEIVTRQLPFQNYRFNYQVLDAVTRGERPALPSSCPSELATLIQGCWRADPCERPSFAEIDNHLTAISAYL